MKKAGGQKVHSAGLCLLEETEMCGAVLGLDAHTGEQGHFPGCSIPRELEHKHTHTVINHINEGSPEVHMLTLFHMYTHGLTHYSSSICKGTTIRSVIYITQWSKLLLWPCFC